MIEVTNPTSGRLGHVPLAPVLVLTSTNFHQMFLEAACVPITRLLSDLVRIESRMPEILYQAPARRTTS